MVYAIGVDVIWENVLKTGWWFVPIIGIWLIVYILNAFAWDIIMRDKNLPVKRHPAFLKVLKVTISGYAINYITPVIALGGEPYRILEMKEGLGVRRATSSVLSYSIMHILSHIVFWMCSIFLIIFWLKPSTGLIIGCIITFCIFAFLLYIIFKGYRKGLVEKVFAMLSKVPFIKKPVKRFAEKNFESFNEIDRNIVKLSTDRKPAFYSALGLELLARIVSCFELLFIAKAVGIDMGLIDSIVLYSGSTLFANILFFSPMQLGTREGGLALVLKMMGFAGSFGIYMGLVMRIRELFWIAIGLGIMRIKTFSKNKKHKKMNIKGIIFDYGGTLDTNGVHWFEVFYDAYQNAKVDIDKETLRKAYIFGERAMEKNSEKIKSTDTFFDNLKMKVEYQLQYLNENDGMCADFSHLKNDIVDWCYRLAKENIIKATAILAKLKDKYSIILVSNFYGNLNSVLKDFKIDGYFNNIIESSVVGIRKPDPDIFRKGLETLKLKAGEVVVIGDSYKNDIEPAQSLGCITVWLKGIGWEPENDSNKTADYVIGKLDEVLALVEN
jgi:HAD superfamily hydrolase (TIGR01509 family)